MNGVSLSNQVIHWNPKKFAVKQNFNKVIKENEKVFNDYYSKSNKAEGVDCFGRMIDLTSYVFMMFDFVCKNNCNEWTV